MSQANSGVVSAELQQLLKWISFLSVDRDRPGVFVNTFLFLKGWNEKDIGFVVFLRAIVALFCQPVMGDVIDKTFRKREYFIVCNLMVSVLGLSFVYFLNYTWVAIALLLQGIALTIMMPALYGLTLGVVGRNLLSDQTSSNEFYSHMGTAVYAVIAGYISLYGDIYWIFYTMSIMAGVCCILVLLINRSAIDDVSARGLDVGSDGKDLAPTRYLELFRDSRVPILLVTVLFYHLANAAMLPLLSQLQSTGNMKLGILVTAVNIAISQIVQAYFSIFVGFKVDDWGSKKLFFAALCILPIRGLIIVLTLQQPHYNRYLLSWTQVLDGMSHGVYTVVHVLIAEKLMYQTGRFNFLLGGIQTCHYVGDAVSNLCGEFLAGHYGYDVAFKALTLCSLIPIVVYGIGMAGRDNDTKFVNNNGRDLEDYTREEDVSTTGLKMVMRNPNQQEEGGPAENPMMALVATAPVMSE